MSNTTHQSPHSGSIIDHVVSYVDKTLPEVLNQIQQGISNMNQRKADKNSVPSKTSQLDNDSGYITNKDIKEKVAETVNNAISEAKKSGEFDGENGFSPIVSIEETSEGARVTITDANGMTTATIKNGKDGKDGEDGASNINKLNVYDLKMVQDTLGIDVLRPSDIIYEYTSGTYQYKRSVILEDYAGVCTVSISDFNGLDWRLVSADGSTTYKVITTGEGVHKITATAGLAIHLQVSKATSVEAGTYFVKGITVYTGDTISENQGLPSYFTGAKQEVEKIMIEPSQTTFMHSVNIADPDKFTQGKYWSPTVYIPSSNTTYFITGYIRVQSGITLWSNYKMRFVTALDGNKKVLADNGATDVNSYTVPEGVNYVVITGYTTQIDNYMINVGDKALSYTPYVSIVDPKHIDGYTREEVDAMMITGGSIVDKYAVLTSDTLAAESTMTLITYPKHLKKNNYISFTAKFDSFAGIYIGKGYNQYRGRWLEITNTDIIDHYYQTSDAVKSTTPHSLTIDSYISVSIVTDNNSTCHVTINTLSGSKTVSLDWDYEHNGYPFVIPLMDMTNCKLTATSPDFDKDVWMFGDSYFGVSPDRIIGQLKNLGFINNVLVDGLAGSTSANSKGDLDKALEFGCPKTLVWCLGMNDSVSSYETYFEEVKALCEQKKIEMIAMRIASVPGKERESLNAIIDNSGIRSVDTYNAVGATSEGTWYDGYLSSDNVHPSVLGAKAIAMRMLVDVPEIMRSGYNELS